MATIYFIGGAPRVGKSQLSIKAVARHPMLATSTDSLRDVLRTAYSENQKPALYTLTHERPDISLKQQILNQNAESREVWTAVCAFVEGSYRDGRDILVEGVAVLPEFLRAFTLPYRVVFVGNTDPTHPQTIKHHARTNEHDWLHGRDEKYVDHITTFVTAFSEFIRAEAEHYGMPYVAMNNSAFEHSQDVALATLFGEKMNLL